MQNSYNYSSLLTRPATLIYFDYMPIYTICQAFFGEFCNYLYKLKTVFNRIFSFAALVDFFKRFISTIGLDLKVKSRYNIR